MAYVFNWTGGVFQGLLKDDIRRSRSSSSSTSTSSTSSGGGDYHLARVRVIRIQGRI